MLITLSLFIMVYYLVCWVLWQTEYSYLSLWTKMIIKERPYLTTTDPEYGSLLLEVRKKYVVSILKKAILMFLLLCWYLSFKFSTFLFFVVVLHRYGARWISPYVDKYYAFYTENLIEIWVVFSLYTWGVILLETLISCTRLPTLLFSSFFGLTALWPYYEYMTQNFYGKFNYFLSFVLFWILFKCLFKPYITAWCIPFFLSKRYAWYYKVSWFMFLVFLGKGIYLFLITWVWKLAIIEALITLVDWI